VSLAHLHQKAEYEKAPDVVSFVFSTVSCVLPLPFSNALYVVQVVVLVYRPLYHDNAMINLPNAQHKCERNGLSQNSYGHFGFYIGTHPYNKSCVILHKITMLPNEVIMRHKTECIPANNMHRAKT
jgi:hypothetical protein